jgi:hypothetical protein
MDYSFRRRIGEAGALQAVRLVERFAATPFTDDGSRIGAVNTAHDNGVLTPSDMPCRGGSVWDFARGAVSTKLDAGGLKWQV